MDSFRDWSWLLPELLLGIAFHLTLMEDFTAFRGVCTNWRAVGALKAKCLSKVPLLMLSEEDDTDEREFFSLSLNKTFIRMSVPQARGQRCIGTGFGWILAASTSSCGEISLFNPFSSSPKIELPGFETFPNPDQYLCGPDHFSIQRVVLSANPSVTSNFTVFVAVNVAFAFWRTGDKSWTIMNIHYGLFGSLGYYKGKIFATGDNFDVICWDPYDPAKAREILLWEYPNVRACDWMPYVVESSDGELLIILRNNRDFCEIGATQFGVMRVDLVQMKTEVINGLGKDAVFIGDNLSTSVVAADFPGVVKPNCIYFTDDLWTSYSLEEYRPKGGGSDMGVYNVEDGSIERFPVESFSLVSPPLWVFPSF